MDIFDFHLHPFYDFHDIDPNPDKFVSALKSAGITRCAGCAINSACQNHPIDQYDKVIADLNDKAWSVFEKYPDFFLPGIHVHPDHVGFSVDEMKKHKARGGVLVGELVYYMMGWRYSHKNTLELMSAARDLGMVVSVHPSKDFEYVESIAENVPDIKLVVAHLDAYGLYERQLQLAKKYDGVYLDISAYGAERDGMLADAVNRIGSQKILFGTDAPGYPVEKFINCVQNADISATDKENILYNNAVKLLNL